MFSENKPAQNINQLLEYLKSNDADSFLYRGQIQDYPACIPSIYRSAISEQASTKDPIVSIANDVFHKSITHQRVARFDLLSLLINMLGKGAGNLVGQQYGLSSEAIDVTSDLNVAAFFATRRYPEYSHFIGTQQCPLGVIYRFPKRQLLTNRTSLDFATYAIGFAHPQY